MKFYLTQIKNKTPPARTLPTIRTISDLIFYLTQIKNQKQTLSSATHIFTPSFKISVKNKLYFYLTQIKFVFRSPIKALSSRHFRKNETKMFRPLFRASETNSNQNGFALSAYHTDISKVPRHLYSNLKPYCRHPTISAHNPFHRDCP